ncbi:MAG: HD domain-containing phosphohydrolase [Rhodocyclaceae bacterium]|nr:HD domain-containing phosphohydrolase [Rhodocyclaceae bacterium]
MSNNIEQPFEQTEAALQDRRTGRRFYDDIIHRFDQLNDIGASLSCEQDINRLLENILIAAKTITHADGGTLYRLTENKEALTFEIVSTDSLGLAMGGTSGVPIHFPNLPLTDEQGRTNLSLVATYAAALGKTVNIPNAYTATEFDFSGTKAFDQRTGYRSCSFLTVPMKNHEDEVIGVLQLINAIDQDTGEVIYFSEADQRLAESLASQAAIALNNRLLLMQLEKLFESFIDLINLAIDEKSPYTGNHCHRVPMLTKMIADAVATATEGPFANFRMSEADAYELRIAAMLHDCGKVTTPVHVVDKATKLETIFDRIQLIDARFEILRRDMEIRRLKGEVSDAPTQCDQQALEDDHAFLTRCNTAPLSDEDIQRVRDIASRYRWIDSRGNENDGLTPDEILNLTIRAGTLTQAERETINNHVVMSLKMLEQLPWPKHLRNVPEFAGGHHERMDGKGYPRGLTGDKMSVQARIIAIADIFEALTARDRPYRRAMKLSQALNILADMAKAGHVDPDIHELFISKKIYLDYATLLLDPAQIDVTD